MKKTLFFMLSLLFLLTASSCSNSDSNKVASSSEPTKSATSIVSEINSTENISTNSTINGTSNSDTFGNVKVINFSSWKKDSIPKFGFNEHNTYNNCLKDFCVALENNKLVAKLGELNSCSNILSVDNGTIVGLDFGEFGGGINFIADNGSGYRILGDNFRGFFTPNNRGYSIIDDKKYVLTGSSHLVSSGNLYELNFIKNKWEANMLIDFHSCPETFLAINEKMYVATDDSLVVVNDGKIIDTLVKNAFWAGLYPNSMIYNNNSIYIGMRGGVYAYNLIDKTEIWYNLSDE